MSGFVSLYRRSGEMVTTKHYNAPSERKLTIATWQKLYAGAYYNCYLQIAPDTNEKGVRDDGTNKRVYEPDDKVFT